MEPEKKIVKNWVNITELENQKKIEDETEKINKEKYE